MKYVEIWVSIKKYVTHRTRILRPSIFGDDFPKNYPDDSQIFWPIPYESGGIASGTLLGGGISTPLAIRQRSQDGFARVWKHRNTWVIFIDVPWQTVKLDEMTNDMTNSGI